MHRTTARVRYAETDQAGVAYHASYLLWYEVGRTEMLRDLGLRYAAFERERGLLLTVVNTELSYHRPARYDDVVAIETWVSDIRRVRFRLEHCIRREGTEELLCRGHLWLACVDREGRTVALPGDLREAIGAHLESGKKEGPRSVPG